MAISGVGPEGPVLGAHESVAVSIKDSAIGTGNRRDAVCAGGKVEIRSLSHNGQGEKLNESQRKEAQEQVASYLKKNGMKKGGEPPTDFAPADISNLEKQFLSLTEGPAILPGLLINIPELTGQPEFSAAALVVFVEYAHAHIGASQADLLKGAFDEIQKLFDVVKKENNKDPLSFSAAVVDKGGTLTSVRSGDVSVVVVGEDWKYLDTTNADGEVNKQKIKDGEKIVLCETKDIQKITDGTKDSKGIVDDITKSNSDELPISSATAEQVVVEKGAAIPVSADTPVVLTDVDRDRIRNQTLIEIASGGRKNPFYEDRPPSNSHDVKVADVVNGTKLKAEVATIHAALADPELRARLDTTSSVGPKHADESEEQYQYRALTHIADMIENQGTYTALPPTHPDRILLAHFSKVNLIGMNQATNEHTLMAAQALVEAGKIQENKRAQEAYDAELADIRKGRFDVTTEEQRSAGDVMEVLGATDLTVDRMQSRAEHTPSFADQELIGSALVTEYFMDIPFREQTAPDGTITNQTYREAMNAINVARMAARTRVTVNQTDVERQALSQEINALSAQARELRRQFYSDTFTMFQHSAQSQARFEAVHGVSSFAKEARKAWDTLAKQPNSLDILTEHYLNVKIVDRDGKMVTRKVMSQSLPNPGPGETAETTEQRTKVHALTPEQFKNRVRTLFQMDAEQTAIPNLSSYAMEGAEFMMRKTEIDVATLNHGKATLPHPNAQTTIRAKNFVKFGEGRGVSAQADNSLQPRPGRQAEITPAPARITTPGQPDDGGLPPAPGNQGENPTRPPGIDEVERPPVAPVREGEPQRTDIEPAPGVQPAEPPPTPTELAANDLQAKMVIAAENGHYMYTNNNLTDHRMSQEQGINKTWPIIKWLTKPPLIGGVFKSIFNPVQMIWRNNLARESVREQNRRFVDKMSLTLKSHFGGTGIDGQMRIPVELTSQLLDKSVIEGQKLLKEKDLLSRIGWGIKNAFTSITTLGETSEMHFAREWLESNLVENTAGKRDPAIEAIYKSALQEQDAVAGRIALGGLRRGEHAKEVPNSPLEAAIKSKIEVYFANIERINRETDTDKKNRLLAEEKVRLVGQINILAKENGTGGDIDVTKGIEIVSNILSVVDDLSKTFGNTGRSKWDVIKEKRKWGAYKLNIIGAESRWGAEGGAETNMGAFRENILRKMADRELFNGEGECAHGVWLDSVAQDFVTYGGAFALGAASSVALKGLSVGAAVVGGLISAPVGGVIAFAPMMAAKEMGFRLWGKELWRGRYRGEVAQVSREMALGKKDPKDATIRKEMGKALVEATMMERADVVATRIEGLLTKKFEDLTEKEAFQILREVAQLDARMRIADISGSKDLQFTVQNYIIYDELQKNEQYLRLKSNVLEGIKKITLYKEAHPDFGGTEPTIDAAKQISTGTMISYDQDQNPLGLFEKFSLLAEAQLRVGTQSEVKKWLTSSNILFNNAGLGLSKNEVNEMVNSYYAEATEGRRMKEGESIRAKGEVLRKLATKRGRDVVLMSALMMPIGGVIYGAEAQVIHGVLQEASHLWREGLSAWSQEWGGIINGTAQPTHPLTIFQEGGMLVRHTTNAIEAQTLPPHDEVIDGVHVQLPAQYKYVPGPHGTDKIIDLEGHTVKDLSGMHLDTIDGKLVEVNGIGDIVSNDAIADFHASGIEMHQSGTIEVSHTETFFNPTGNTIESTLDSHTVQIPEGTHWTAPDAEGNIDLVLDTKPDFILIDNAHIGADGVLTAASFFHTSAENIMQNPGSEAIPNLEQSRFDEVSGKYGYTFASKEGMIYDYKDGDTLIIKAGGESFAWKGGHATMDGIMEEGALRFAVQIPCHGTILVPPNFEMGGKLNALSLDPNDTNTFTLAHGETMTYGELARTIVNQEELQKWPDGSFGVEWMNHQNVLSLKPAPGTSYGFERTHGTISSAYLINPSGYIYHGNTTSTGVTDGTQMDGAIIAISAITGTHPAGYDQTPSVLPIPTVMIDGPLTHEVSQTLPTFTIDPPPIALPHFMPPLIPVPMGRQNVEAAESAITGHDAPTPTTPANPTPATPVTPAENVLVLTDVEKGTIKKDATKEVEEGGVYTGKDKLFTELGLKIEKDGDFGKYETAKQKTESNGRVKKTKDALEAYEKRKREVENAKTPEEKDKAETAMDKAEKDLEAALKGRENGWRASSFDKADTFAKLDKLIEAEKEKKIQIVINRLEKEALEKKREAAPATPATPVTPITPIVTPIPTPTPTPTPPPTTTVESELTLPEKNKIILAKNEIFEKAGHRNAAQMNELIKNTREIHWKMLEAGVGKLPVNITEADKLGFKDIVCEGFVTYIPKGKGELVVVGDLHGDFATLEQIVNKKQFIQNMEAGDKSMMLVFEGDYLDRGKKDVEVMEALLEMKRRYPNNVVLMKADHEGEEGSVSHHDYPARAKAHYKDEEVFKNLHSQFLDILPRAVFCGNGAVMLHGGPAAYDFDLQKLAQLHGNKHAASVVFDGGMTWADPEIMDAKRIDKNKRIGKLINTEVTKAIEVAEKASGNTAMFEGEEWHLSNLKSIKHRINVASEHGFWFNEERVGENMDAKGKVIPWIGNQKFIHAILQNVTTYSEQGLEYFLSKVGGKVLIRGHEVSSEVVGGKPNPFSKNIMWTIHSTGKGSGDSYYAMQELHPTFAVFDRNTDVITIDPAKNIKGVWDMS